MCCHVIAVAWKSGCLGPALQSYKGRCAYSISTSTAAPSVGKKASGNRQRKVDVEGSFELQGHYGETSTETDALSAQALNPTTVVIKKTIRPEDPLPAAPRIIKEIRGNIRKCAGCTRSLSSEVQGFWQEEDAHFCCGRYEAYHYWNKGCNSYQLSSGIRHYHVNPVCTKHFRSSNKNISLGPGITRRHAITQIAAERFGVRIL